MWPSTEIEVAALAWVEAEATRGLEPREACGVIISTNDGPRWFACRNIAPHGDAEFEAHHEDLARAEACGPVAFVVHSHIYIPALPTMPDLVGAEAWGVPWIIVSWPTMQVHAFRPSGFKAPLEGRPFFHGVLDCFALIRDYYQDVLGIQIPDFERPQRWWEDAADGTPAANLYLEHYAEAGFVQIDGPPQLHDVILMQIFSEKRLNHGAVYVGDGVILQHLMGRNSGKYPWSGYWRRQSGLTLRHRSNL